MHPPGEASTRRRHLPRTRPATQGLPPVWLVYITVDDLDQAISRCQELGGKVLRAATGMGPNGRYCVIEDPAGATCALFEAAKAELRDAATSADNRE